MSGEAIGVFDSGLGGLTCVKELIAIAPKENIIFFGDTARLPYGAKTPETIVRFALQNMTFLLNHNVKMIIAACGTVSSNLPREMSERLPIPFLGIVEPTAAAAVKASRSGKIGIIGTAATIASGALERAVKKLSPDAQVISRACPMFVPLVENGYTSSNSEVTRIIAKEYLAPLRKAGVDTLVLGCTHYPIIADVIASVMGSGVALIDSGKETALEAVRMLDSFDKLGGEGTRSYTISDDKSGFAAGARLFLGEDFTGTVESLSLDGTKPHTCFEETK